MKRLSVLEAWTVGVGLNARLTTEIIVAKLLLDSKLITLELFTALVSAASFTTFTVPLVFALLVRKWGDMLRTKKGAPPSRESSHVSYDTVDACEIRLRKPHDTKRRDTC